MFTLTTSQKSLCNDLRLFFDTAEHLGSNTVMACYEAQYDSLYVNKTEVFVPQISQATIEAISNPLWIYCSEHVYDMPEIPEEFRPHFNHLYALLKQIKVEYNERHQAYRDATYRQWFDGGYPKTTLPPDLKGVFFVFPQ